MKAIMLSDVDGIEQARREGRKGGKRVTNWGLNVPGGVIVQTIVEALSPDGTRSLAVCAATVAGAKAVETDAGLGEIVHDFPMAHFRLLTPAEEAATTGRTEDASGDRSLEIGDEDEQEEPGPISDVEIDEATQKLKQNLDEEIMHEKGETPVEEG